MVLMVVAHPLRTHETQMFYRVRGPRHIVRIAEATNVDIHSSGSFISVWIVDQKNFQLIEQLDQSVRTLVQ
jgi:hypothetical protein